MEFRNKDKANLSDILKFEEKYKVKLPQVYVDFLLSQNGGFPAKGLHEDVECPYKNTTLDFRFFFGINTKEDPVNLEISIQYINDLPQNYLPIARDYSGGLYIIYMMDTNAPVYYWPGAYSSYYYSDELDSYATNEGDMIVIDDDEDHTIKFYKVADSFTEFLNGLILVKD